MTERNLSRALDEISTLKRQVETQAQTITRLNIRNGALQRRNAALEGLVGKYTFTRTGGARNG